MILNNKDSKGITCVLLESQVVEDVFECVHSVVLNQDISTNAVCDWSLHGCPLKTLLKIQILKLCPGDSDLQ